jgi:hypothetical protein
LILKCLEDGKFQDKNPLTLNLNYQKIVIGDLEYDLEPLERDLKLMMEYELVLSSYLYHALTNFALRGI